MPNIGDLDKRMSFIAVQKVDNGRGGWTETKLPPFTVWAKVRQLTAREIIRYKAYETEIDTIIETRYREELKKAQTATIGNRRFEIDKVIDKEQDKRFLEIVAREVF